MVTITRGEGWNLTTDKPKAIEALSPDERPIHIGSFGIKSEGQGYEILQLMEAANGELRFRTEETREGKSAKAIVVDGVETVIPYRLGTAQLEIESRNRVSEVYEKTVVMYKDNGKHEEAARIPLKGLLHDLRDGQARIVEMVTEDVPGVTLGLLFTRPDDARGILLVMNEKTPAERRAIYKPTNPIPEAREVLGTMVRQIQEASDGWLTQAVSMLQWRADFRGEKQKVIQSLAALMVIADLSDNRSLRLYDRWKILTSKRYSPNEIKAQIVKEELIEVAPPVPPSVAVLPKEQPRVDRAPAVAIKPAEKVKKIEAPKDELIPIDQIEVDQRFFSHPVEMISAAAQTFHDKIWRRGHSGPWDYIKPYDTLLAGTNIKKGERPDSSTIADKNKWLSVVKAAFNYYHHGSGTEVHQLPDGKVLKDGVNLVYLLSDMHIFVNAAKAPWNNEFHLSPELTNGVIVKDINLERWGNDFGTSIDKVVSRDSGVRTEARQWAELSSVLLAKGLPEPLQERWEVAQDRIKEYLIKQGIVTTDGQVNITIVDNLTANKNFLAVIKLLFGKVYEEPVKQIEEMLEPYEPKLEEVKR